MKLYLAIIMLCLMSLINAVAQKNNQVALNCSAKQFELAYNRNIADNLIWAEVYAGVGKYDMNRKPDDFCSGLRLGLPVFKFKGSSISIAVSTSLYIPRNEYYSAPTMVYGIYLNYEKYLGKLRRHSLLFNIGYQYGHKDYIQTYESNLISVASTGHFKISPAYLSAGYGFNF